MANTYVAPDFDFDTSTNVAGATAIKGGAPAVTDNFYIYSTVAGANTFTIESVLSCKKITLGTKKGGAADANYRYAHLAGSAGAGLIFGGGADGTLCIDTSPTSADASSKALTITFTGTSGSRFAVTNSGDTPSNIDDWTIEVYYGNITATYCTFKWFRLRAFALYSRSLYSNGATNSIINSLFYAGNRASENAMFMIPWQGNVAINIPLILTFNTLYPYVGFGPRIGGMEGDYCVAPMYIDTTNTVLDSTGVNEIEFGLISRLSASGTGAGALVLYTGSNIWSTVDIRTIVPTFSGVISVVNNGDGSITITWGAATSEDHFRIYLKNGSAPADSDIACQAAADATSVRIKYKQGTALTAGGDWYARVNAFNASGTSDGNVATAHAVVTDVTSGAVGVTVESSQGVYAGNGAMATIYTCPANKTAVIKGISVVNEDSGARTIRLQILKSGGTARNIVPIDTVLAASPGITSYLSETLGMTVTLEAGDILQAQSDAASKVMVTPLGLMEVSTT